MTGLEDPSLQTSRLSLEPIDESHAEELCALFADPELHRLAPSDPPTIEQQRERCARWASRRSPDGAEIWLNWAGREKSSGKLIAHFQAGVQRDGVASVGYVIARGFQRRGFAFEGMEAVFSYLRDALAVREVRAWSDTRNEASHRLAQKLGMRQVDRVQGADFFKGASSDEYVFSKIFAAPSPSPGPGRWSLSTVEHAELQSYKTGEKFSFSAVLSELVGFKDVFVHHDIIPAGRRASGSHAHGSREEMVFVLEGSVTAVLGGESHALGAGDFMGFAPGVAHFVRNEGNELARILVIASNPPQDEVIDG